MFLGAGRDDGDSGASRDEGSGLWCEMRGPKLFGWAWLAWRLEGGDGGDGGRVRDGIAGMSL
jgi:hypothetical protein